MKVLEAGVDQFGGEDCPELLRRARRRRARSARNASTSRRDGCCARSSCSACSRTPTSTSRMRQTRSSARAEFRAAGEAAQRASITVLTNSTTVPAPPAVRARAAGCTSRASMPRSPPRTATVVATPAEADLAIIRTAGAVRGARDDVRELLPRRARSTSPTRPSRTCARSRPPFRPSSTCSSIARRSSRRSSDAAAAVVGNCGALRRALLDVLTALRRRRASCRSTSRRAGRRRGEPRRRAVRHGRSAVPLRARAHPLRH